MSNHTLLPKRYKKLATGTAKKVIRMNFLPILHSRAHRLLNYVPDSDALSCYIKRDDELSAGISGSKYRKYASLIPYLRQHGYQHIGIIAAAHANNLLAALQLLREHHFQITAFLLKPHNELTHGNFKLSQLFLKQDEIVWVERTQWPDVEEIAAKHLAHIPHTFVLPEGASTQGAIAGAKSLATDIVRNQRELTLNFEHIFLDAGTGFSAAACIKQLEELKHPAQVHILLLADNETVFRNNAYRWVQTSLQNCCFFRPSNAKSFGSVNKTLRLFIRDFAYQHGVLLDPLYSAKLFYEAKHQIIANGLQGNILIVHSGGLLSLPHFELF